VKLLERALRYNKPARAGYICDRDHKGEGMPVSFSRHTEFYAYLRGIVGDLRLRLLALTDEQVERHGLPRKPSEGKQGEDRFEEEHGGMVEVDALEALVPGELERLLDEWHAPYVDDTLEDRLADAGDEAIQVAEEAWTAEIAPEMADLETLRHGVGSVMEGFRAEIEDLQGRLEEALRPYQEQADDLADRIATKAQFFDPELPERPVAQVNVVEEDDWLFDLNRGYLSQINAYRRHKGQPPIVWCIPEDPQG
jgi:hypothetical protein